MAQLYSNILKTIGKTPIVRLNNIAPKHVEVFVKCEFFNPLGSVKDRVGVHMIEEAEKSGALTPGMTVFEVTSGNAGISLAMACAVKGYKLVVAMPPFFSKERIKILKFLGAKVILTPTEMKATHMLKWGKELTAKNGWFYTDQFGSSANPDAHRRTTGPEILSAFANEGKQLDYFVAGYATGGTLCGVGEVLKAALPDITIVCGEPESAALVSGGEYVPHVIEGWANDVIPQYVDVGMEIFDQNVLVSEEEAISTSRKLGAQEGIFTGFSGGASVAAALKVAETAPVGSTILAMLPDTGERYLSTALYEGITEESDDLEPHEVLSFDAFMPTQEELDRWENAKKEKKTRASL